MISTPWRIEPRDPDLSVDRKEIQHYEDLFDQTEDGYENHLEMVLEDGLDTPLGGCSEIVRDPDTLDGRVVHYQHMDAATLFVTPFKDFPIVQKVPGVIGDPIVFPKRAVDRLGWSPRTEIRQKGWFMAPPERIYLALQMLVQGDQYYWKLLQDTPEMGILDLGDMEKQAAMDWLDAWKGLLGGVDPFKIPVLYEHTQDVKYIQLNRPPSDIIFDKITLMRASFAVAGYGITLADVGISVEGVTLAGAIRGERRSERTGFARARAKVSRYWNNMLPRYLKFTFVERDDERLVSKGRARLANSMAFRNLTEAGILLEEDAQQQLVSDGLITVPISKVNTAVGGEIVEPNRLVSRELGSPVPPSSGGEGEITNRSITSSDVAAFMNATKVMDSVGNELYTDLVELEMKDLLRGVLDLEQLEKEEL
jgi:hypothetical protein